MGKLDELRRLTGGNVDDSIGVGRAARASEAPATSAPIRWQGVTKSRNAAEIPVDKIDRDPDQPREEFEPEVLERLAESLKTRGQLQPIRVRWDEGRGVYMILVGERRWRAARMAGLQTLSAVVVDGPIEPAELLAIQLIENCLREDLKPIEQAKAFKGLIERNGWSARQVAREMAIDHTSVTRALALLSLPGDVQEAVEAGQIAPRTAYELTKIDDPTEQATAAREAAAGRLKHDDLVERNRNPRKGRGTKKPAKDRVFRSPVGRVTVEMKRAGGPEAMLGLLEEAANIIRNEMAAGETAAA